MATVNFALRTKSNPANINIRFSAGRAINIYSTLGIHVNPIHWDGKRQKLRNLIELPNRDAINSKLDKLKTFVIDQFNLDYMNGDVIDKDWLDATVNKFMNRPEQEVKKVIEKRFIFFLDFAFWWLENKAKTWKSSNNKSMAPSAKRQYNSHLEIIKRFEEFSGKKLKFKSLTEDAINDVITYMEETEKYDYKTVKRHIGRLKFFCLRAEAENILINNNFKDRFIATKTEEIVDPYHDENEIEKIFKKDFSYNEEFENARDNFIIGLWTGLRISDFNNRLDISNIKDDFIDIKTTKTDTWVSIPVHPHIRFILDKRCGLLPPRVSDSKFNKLIKTICRVCKIDQEMKGKLMDPKLKRNVIGIYPKYKLVSSHICRRSFATNLFGLVPNWVIMEAGGWSSESMMLLYIKKTKREGAEIIKNTWDKKYSTEQK